MVQDLWTPPGTVQEETAHLGRVNPDLSHEADSKEVALGYTFTFTYKGKVKKLQVIAGEGDSRAEIEDKAAEVAERWKQQLDQQEHKREPTADEKKDIGAALNDIRVRMEKRRESSTGTLVFKGLK